MNIEQLSRVLREGLSIRAIAKTKLAGRVKIKEILALRAFAWTE